MVFDRALQTFGVGVFGTPGGREGVEVLFVRVLFVAVDLAFFCFDAILWFLSLFFSEIS
ncbi:MAG: hypothetical protein AB1553_11170 [Nitrospirota bacterium]